MKKNIFLIVLIILLSCRNGPDSVPLGTWNYALLMNGVEIGRAMISNSISDNNYVSIMEMEVKAGDAKNIVKQIVTETMNFVPVKVESYNKTVNGGVHEVNIIAEFRGNEVTLDAGGTKTKIILKKPFHLDGNFFLAEFAKKNYSSGSEIKAFIYEPAIEIDEPVSVRVKILGRANVKVNGKKRDLIHVIESIENHKFVDSYLDDNGVPQKTTIAMLNSRFELIIRE